MNRLYWESPGVSGCFRQCPQWLLLVSGVTIVRGGKGPGRHPAAGSASPGAVSGMMGGNHSRQASGGGGGGEVLGDDQAGPRGRERGPAGGGAGGGARRPGGAVRRPGRLGR